MDKWVMEAVAVFDLSTAQGAQKEKEQLVADFNAVSEMATELKVELSKSFRIKAQDAGIQYSPRQNKTS